MNEDIFHLGIKAIIRDVNGKILLNKKISGQYWDLPGGRISKGETVEQTLKRELKEEIGVNEIKSMFPFSMVISNFRLTKEGDVGLILSIYLCELENINNISAKEPETEICWFEVLEASRLLEAKYPKNFTEEIKKLR